jgi:hypothetical protein
LYRGTLSPNIQNAVSLYVNSIEWLTNNYIIEK